MARNRFVTTVVALVGAAVVAALFHFNRLATSYNQYIVGNLIGLFWVPMLTILFVFREEPDRFGFTLGSSKRVWLAAAVLFLPLFALMLAVSRWQSFQSYYPLFRQYPEFSGLFARHPGLNAWSAAPWLMAYAEVSYGMYLFCWEFFFRGFLLFGIARLIGSWSILPQAIAFGIMHAGKPGPEVACSFAAGIILGIVALRAKSFAPCFVLHWAAAVTFDVLVILAKRGVLF